MELTNYDSEDLNSKSSSVTKCVTLASQVIFLGLGIYIYTYFF